ncbi:InlB B-repeat-containing protein [Amedibacillus sp. YH-ame10]
MKRKNNHKNDLLNKIRKIMLVLLLTCSVFQIHENVVDAAGEENVVTTGADQEVDTTQEENLIQEESDVEEVKESERSVEEQTPRTDIKEQTSDISSIGEQPKAVASGNATRSATDVLSNWEYLLNGDLYILTKYIGSNLDIVIPSLIDGKKVAIDISSDSSKYQSFFPSTTTSITIEDTGSKVTLVQNTLTSVFRAKSALTTLNLSNLDTSNIINMSNAITLNGKLEFVDVTGWDTSNVTSMSGMFQQNKSLKQIKGMRFNTSKVEKMEDMFHDDVLLTSIDVSSFNTSSVKNTARMFSNCVSLRTLDVSGFDTTNVTAFSEMFYNCENLEIIDVSNFNTGNAISMNSMFLNCKKVKALDVTNFNTLKVNQIDKMFAGCESLVDLDVSGFTTAPEPAEALNRVRTISDMFNGCKSLKKIDLSSFNSTAILFMAQAFVNCSSVQVFDLEDFNTPNLQTSSLGIKDVFTIADPTISEPVPTIIISKASQLSGFDQTITGRTYGGPLYNANGGKFATDEEEVRYFDHFVFANRDEFSVTKKTIADKFTPNKQDSTFTGWYTDEECTTPFVADTTGVDLTTDEYMNLTLYAGWAKTITFDSRGGNNVDSVEVQEGDLITKPSDPTKAGVSFVGWYTDSALTTKWNFDTDTVIDNITLYAAWGYDVTFVANNGTADSKVVVKEKSPVDKPTDPSRTGYTFKGWYKESNFTTPWDFTNDIITANTKIYARWKINEYTVTFANTALDSTTAEHGSVVTKPEDPNKTGYTFIGWYKEPTYNTTWDFTNDKITQNTTIYAKWEINKYAVTFDEIGIPGQSIDYGNKVLKPTDPSKTGYTFGGWFKESTFVTRWDFDNDTVIRPITLYAKWNINKYTVTFANTTLDSATVEHGSVITKPTNPTKKGYTFKGWYQNENYTIEWDFDNQQIIQNTTIYAKWENITSKVFFDAKNGEETMQQKEIVYDQVYGALPTPSNGTLIFGGWYTQPYGKGTQKKDTDKVNVVEDEILYAHWLKDFYDTTDGNLRFENAQDSRYVLQIDANDKEFVQDSQNLKSVYDIYLLLDNDRVNIKNTEIWVSIKLKENERNYTNYKVVYINELGEKVEEFIPMLSEEKDVLMFKVTHLSYYAVYAWNAEEVPTITPPNKDSSSDNSTKDVVTGVEKDNTHMYVVMIVISLSFVCVIALRKKKSKIHN